MSEDQKSEELLPDCPICQMISAGEVLKSGDRCCVIMWGTYKVAVALSHIDQSDLVDMTEAIQLLTSDNTEQLYVDFSEVAGHWGIKAIPAGEISSIGRSIGRTE